MKKFATWVVVNILWPILKELLGDILKQLIKLMAEGVKALLAKWFKQDVEAASSEAEKEEVRKRYEERRSDIDDITARMTEKVDDIVEQALAKSEPNRDLLLEAKGPDKSEPKRLSKASDA